MKAAGSKEETGYATLTGIKNKNSDLIVDSHEKCEGEVEVDV